MRSRPARGTCVSSTIHQLSIKGRNKDDTHLLSEDHLGQHLLSGDNLMAAVLTTSSPFMSPFRARSSESSLLSFPRAELWMSVAKKHTEESTLGSKAA